MEVLRLRPNAKINLGLFIKGKRADGYHLLETLLYPLPSLTDILTIHPSSTPGCELRLHGISLDSPPENNLVSKAYQALKTKVPDLPGVRIQLDKGIPSGAGLGGGSSDAAFTLKGLSQFFQLGLSDAELAELATPLGADVPFFIYNRPLLAKGIGTEFEAIDLELPFRIEVLTPQLHSSTVAAYQSLDYRQCDPKRDLRQVLLGPVKDWPFRLENDLEKPVFARYPQLKHLKASLYEQGAHYAAMSGSGSAVFGLFDLS